MDPNTPSTSADGDKPGSSITPTSPSTAPVTPTVAPQGKKPLGRNAKLAIAGAAVVVLGAAGYTFGYYIPNKPENVYKSALSNTSKGYDKLVEYATDKDVTNKFKNTETNGTFKFNSTDATGDGSFKVRADENNATFSGDVGVSGQRIKLEGRLKDAQNSESPDIYLKVAGINGLGASMGMPAVDELDDKWIEIDHTLIDGFASQIEQSAGGEEMKNPSQSDITEAAKAIGGVNEKYLFSTDEKNAVLEMKQYVGKETVDGKSTHHYKVKADKENLKEYVKELGKALDKTKLNDWAKKNYDKPLSELMDIESINKSIDDSKNKDFDLWVNAKTKMVHKLRMPTSDDGKNYTEIGLNYDKGDVYPFFINSKEGDMMSKVTLAINTKTNILKMDADFKNSKTKDGGKIALEVKPVEGKLSVEKPSEVLTLLQAMDKLGMGAYYDMLTQGGLTDTSTDTTASNESMMLNDSNLLFEQ